jgi:hypothetical protein
MPKVIRTRPKVGDIVEFRTPRGTAYALCTHFHKKPPHYGALLRVFRGFHSDEPEDYSKLVRSEVQFSAFFPLGAACQRKIVRIVANEEIPETLRNFPLFKTGVEGKDGKIQVWWLWDGDREWRVGPLEEKYLDSPMRGIVNDTWIVDRLIRGTTEREETISKTA